MKLPNKIKPFLITLSRCCISAHAQEKTDGDTNRPVSDKIVQSMFYKAQHQETGNMWDVWLYPHKGTYFLYHLAYIANRWHWNLRFAGEALAGGRKLGIKQGQHLVFEKDATPLCNLHVTLLQGMGMEQDHFVDGTGPLAGLR